MDRLVFRLSCTFLLAWGIWVLGLTAQQQPHDYDEGAYGSKFFDQLRKIFGAFRDSDLQRVFQEAQPIQCSELVGRKGEWRQVAFFNEDRTLGDWCRDSLEEVKADLTVYTFKGVCTGDQGKIQVSTEFPTSASLQDYSHQRIDLDHVDITVNDPVTATLNARTMAYTFDLPYLFQIDRDSRKVYSFIAPDRGAVYATDVTSRWECKAVSSKDVTYRFMICRVNTIPQHVSRNQRWEPSFGSSAFFILSDGTEAQTSVHLSFGDGTSKEEKPEDTTPSTNPARPTLKRR
jgi:hypothetical protein